MLSDPEQYAWFPEIIADDAGNVYAIWAAGYSENNIAHDLLMMRVQRQGAWLPANDILAPGAGGYAVRASPALDRQGVLHLAYRHPGIIRHTRALASIAETAASWSEPLAVNAGQDGYYPEIAVSDPNTIHVVWTAMVPTAGTPYPGEPCRNCSDIFYRQSVDGGETWSTRINLSNTLTGSVRPQLRLSPDGELFVVWEEGRDTYVGPGKATTSLVSVSHDGGQSWSQPRELGAPGVIAQQPTIGFDANGAAIVVWRSLSDEVYFQRSTDGGTSWSDALVIPGIAARDWNDTPFDHLHMARDSAGHLHLVTVGQAATQSGLGVWRLEWDGERWLAPDLISGNENYPEWPYIAVGQGNQLHVVWFERDAADRFRSGEAGVVYHVWYSTRSVDAPVQVGPAPPTPTATPLPVTPTPTIRPTLRPLNLEPLERTGATATQPNLDANATTLLLVSGVPTIFLAAVVWTLRRWRR